MAEYETSIGRNGSDDDPLSSDDADRLLKPLIEYAHVTLAVSGGPDSLALMLLAASWQRRTCGAPSLDVVTFDHRLRPASAAEAAFVAARARDAGLPHHIIAWDDGKPATGLANASRDARYAALGAHAEALMAARQSNNVPVAIVTAHHRDDQAETLLMRLARGTGVAGLAGMAAARVLNDDSAHAVWLVRPFLDVAKARLEATVLASGWQAINDPSNSDERFERARWRRRMIDIAQLGLSSTALARTARRAGEAADAIEYAARFAARDAVAIYRPGLWATARVDVLAPLPAMIRNSVLNSLIDAFSGATARPTLAEMERLGAALASGRESGRFAGATLGGTVFAPAPENTVLVFREWRRITHPVAIRPGETALWDDRLRIGLSLDAAPAAIRPAGDLSNAERKRLAGAAVDGVPHAAWQALPVLDCRDLGLFALTPDASRGAPSPLDNGGVTDLGGAGWASVAVPPHRWFDAAVHPPA